MNNQEPDEKQVQEWRDDFEALMNSIDPDGNAFVERHPKSDTHPSYHNTYRLAFVQERWIGYQLGRKHSAAKTKTT